MPCCTVEAKVEGVTSAHILIMRVLLMPHTGMHSAEQDELDEGYPDLIHVLVIIQELTERCHRISRPRSCI